MMLPRIVQETKASHTFSFTYSSTYIKVYLEVICVCDFYTTEKDIRNLLTLQNNYFVPKKGKKFKIKEV